MKIIKNSKPLAMRGNAIDLAVGVIIGATFGSIVSTFMKGMIMPPAGKIAGNLGFNNLYLLSVFQICNLR
jgi:large conductance mechanosensitive channel